MPKSPRSPAFRTIATIPGETDETETDDRFDTPSPMMAHAKPVTALAIQN